MKLGEIFIRLSEIRRTSFNFSKKPISDEILMNIFKAGLYAPYGQNPPQPWLVNIYTKQIKRRIAYEITKYKEDYNEPYAIAIVSVPKDNDKLNQLVHIGSGWAFIYNVMLMAISYGIVVSPFAPIPNKLINLLYDITGWNENERFILAILSVGYVEKIRKRRNVNLEEGNLRWLKI